MKRPTTKQLKILRGVLGNGWGDGDYLEYCFTPAEKRKAVRAMIAFDTWLEHLQGAQFAHPLIGKRAQ